MSKQKAAAAAPVSPDTEGSAELPEECGAPDPVLSGETVKARVLRDCQFGSADEVALIPVEHIDIAVACGAVDAHPDAVAYAESLQ